MTATTAGTSPSKRPQLADLDPMRRSALVVGVLFLITTSRPSLPSSPSTHPSSTKPTTSSGEGRTLVLWAAFAELLLIAANIGTAVALYRQGFPTLRGHWPAGGPAMISVDSLTMSYGTNPPCRRSSRVVPRDTWRAAQRWTHLCPRFTAGGSRENEKVGVSPRPRALRGRCSRRRARRRTAHPQQVRTRCW